MKRLTPHLRVELQAPFTKPVSTSRALTQVKAARAQRRLVVAVGDAVCAVLERARLPPNLAVFDFVSQRRRTKPQQQNQLKRMKGRLVHAYNPAGYLSYSLTHATTSALRVLAKHPRLHVKILVEGEEDLAVLPALAQAPQGSLVLYGQPNQGVVIVPVTPEWKRKANAWLAKFKPAP